MNNMEIQQEAIIEIIGTQYNERAINHKDLTLTQKLVMKHQMNNEHDANAVIITTNTGKELGLMPKGYASLYAPAIDSKKYSFIVEVIKTEYDTERPILIVKITAEYNGHNEQDVEKNILKYTQDIINGLAQEKSEYMKFIYSKTVDFDELVICLNKARLYQKLYSLFADIIKKNNIECPQAAYTTYTKEKLLKVTYDIQTDISNILKKIQKEYNEYIDIDDDIEYNKKQSEIRERRKKFRAYKDLFEACYETIDKFVYVEAADANATIDVQGSVPSDKNTMPDDIAESTDAEQDVVAEESNTSAPETPQEEIEEITEGSNAFTEQAFLTWLISDKGVSEKNAEQYISNIHSIEKLYQTLFGERNDLFGTSSTESAKAMIESLIVKKEYIDANERRRNNFNIALDMFAQFADITIEKLISSIENENTKVSEQAKKYTVKTVDFNNPHSCTYCKPCAFRINNNSFSAESWLDLYKKYLILLHTNSHYTKQLRSLIGKSLYGNRMDFADKNHKQELRRALEISYDFYAEGNLSAADIIRHIKCLMDLCSISYEHMVIEYITNDKTYNTLAEHSISHQKEQTEVLPEPKQKPVETPKENEHIQEDNNITATDDNETETSDVIEFTPDTSKRFVLKDAAIEILSSDATEIKKYKEYKNGINTKGFSDILKKYYNKTVARFELAKLLLIDKTFQAVGKGYFVLDPKQLPQEKPVIEAKPTMPTNENVAQENTDEVKVNSPVMLDDEPSENKAENSESDISTDAILELMKENCDKPQYEDGFGTYEIKTLLANKGITDISEDTIESLMSECPKMKEIEDGYYVLTDSENDTVDNKPDSLLTQETPLTAAEIPAPQENIPITNGHIVLDINGKTTEAYDYSDALKKVCEFAINHEPFKMARIAGQGIQLRDKNVFYRKSVPVYGYNRLSNDLQVMNIDNTAELQTITNEIKDYCQLDDDMIKIISE